jgi:hypothetical protein
MTGAAGKVTGGSDGVTDVTPEEILTFGATPDFSSSKKGEANQSDPSEPFGRDCGFFVLGVAPVLI